MPDALHGDTVPASFVCVCGCGCGWSAMYMLYVNVPVHEYDCIELIRIYALYHICAPSLYVRRTSHTERDVNMKRQLVEDLKTRLKFLQEMEKSYRGQVEELEKKVHAADAVIMASY